MIQYRDWYIWTQGQVVARQFDHMTRSLEVVGELPEGWEWTVIVRVGEYMDYLPLTPTQTGASITLTAQQLALPGMYSIQLRGKQGELVRHTNVLSVYVPASLSGDAHWPEIPSEFTRLEQRVLTVGEQAAEVAKQAETAAAQITGAMETIEQAKDEVGRAALAAGESAAVADASEHAAQGHKASAEAAAALAGSYTSHPPVVGENGNWCTWNGMQYVDSGKPSQGELTRTQGNALYAHALKGEASGAAVRMDDVSPLEHGVPVRVRSKNLIPYPHFDTTTTIQGVTFTENEDGTVTANGTAAGSAGFLLINTNTPLPIKAGTYVLSGCPKGGDNSNKYSLVVGWRKTPKLDGRITLADIGEGAVCTFEEDGYFDVVVVVRAGYTVNNLVFKPQLEKDTAATAYTPYVPDLTAVTVYRRGKNLFNSARIPETTSYGGLTVTRNGNLITINGSQNENRGTLILGAMWVPVGVGVSYTLSIEHISGAMSDGQQEIIVTSALDRSGTGETNWLSTWSSPTYGANEDMVVTAVATAGYFANFMFWAPVGAVYDNYTFRVQLEVGAAATDYEPYVEPVTYTPAEDGTCEVKSIAPTMTLLTDTAGVTIECEYNRDINKAFEQLQQAILSMGGNI